jgi:hypothetical protein
MISTAPPVIEIQASRLATLYCQLKFIKQNSADLLGSIGNIYFPCPGWRGAVCILSTVPMVDWVLLGSGETIKGIKYGSLCHRLVRRTHLASRQEERIKICCQTEKQQTCRMEFMKHRLPVLTRPRGRNLGVRASDSSSTAPHSRRTASSTVPLRIFC